MNWLVMEWNHLKVSLIFALLSDELFLETKFIAISLFIIFIDKISNVSLRLISSDNIL